MFARTAANIAGINNAASWIAQFAGAALAACDSNHQPNAKITLHMPSVG
jgi:hypothetical protein